MKGQEDSSIGQFCQKTSKIGQQSRRFLLDLDKKVCQYGQLVDQSSDVKKWEADPRPLQSKSATTDAKLVVISGLRCAWSINAKIKKASFGNNWVPQGVTQSKDVIYMSWYDGNQKLNSIIVQVNKHNAKYNKTLILRSKSHVGGFTYDIDHQRLLWSDDAAQITGAVSVMCHSAKSMPIRLKQRNNR